VIHLHNQRSNNFCKEQQQIAKWSRLSRYVCSFTAFPVGGPSKGVHYTPSGFRGQCPLRRLWLLTCHITTTILIFRAAGGKFWTWRLWNGRQSRRWVWLIFVLVSRCINSSPCRCPNPFQFLVFDSETADKPVPDANLGLEGVDWKTVAKVGMAHLHPSCQQMCNICPHCCPNPLQFLVFDSETADEPVSDVKPRHVAFWGKLYCSYCTEQQNLNWEKSNICRILDGNVSFPHLRTITQLPVSNTVRFNGLNIPFHLLSARLN